MNKKLNLICNLTNGKNDVDNGCFVLSNFHINDNTEIADVEDMRFSVNIGFAKNDMIMKENWVKWDMQENSSENYGNEFMLMFPGDEKYSLTSTSNLYFVKMQYSSQVRFSFHNISKNELKDIMKDVLTNSNTIGKFSTKEFDVDLDVKFAIYANKSMGDTTTEAITADSFMVSNIIDKIEKETTKFFNENYSKLMEAKGRKDAYEAWKNS